MCRLELAGGSLKSIDVPTSRHFDIIAMEATTGLICIKCLEQTPANSKKQIHVNYGHYFIIIHFSNLSI